MKAVLFNIHDVALLLTIGACALLGSIHLGSWRRPKWVGRVFALFLATNALVAFNTLIFWAEPIRHPVFSVFPYLYLLLSAAGFLLGPLLYWHSKAHVDPHFRPGRNHWWHLLPALFALAYLYVECFRFPPGIRRDLFLNLQIYHQPYAFYGHFITLEKLLPVVYAAWCLGLIRRQGHGNNRYSIGAGAMGDLFYVVGGFTTVWVWGALTHFLGTAYPGDVSDLMGILGNYFTLGLMVLLIYRELRASLQPSGSTVQAGRENEELNQEHVDQIAQAMAKDKVFLNPQLTLERFAELVGCSPREVSAIINGHFRQNFHEFVSGYRIEEVKANLRDPAYGDWTIPSIAQAAGFNSKATFHRFFKKLESTTPNEYRKQHQGGTLPIGTSSQNT
jgi:AraC-like DNA-binding protein